MMDERIMWEEFADWLHSWEEAVVAMNLCLVCREPLPHGGTPSGLHDQCYKDYVVQPEDVPPEMRWIFDLASE